MDILYEDELLVVCVKPRGVLSAADASGKQAMADLLAPRTVYPVHRLDRDTPGLMVFAKTAEAAAKLTELHKEYLALLTAAPAASEGELTDLLYHDRFKNKTYTVKRKRAGVKEARLSYRMLTEQLVRVRLYTGRTHQIRVQFASRRCPLEGDRKYGGTNGELQLYAWHLWFRHPNGQDLDFFLPKTVLPAQFLLVKEVAAVYNIG